MLSTTKTLISAALGVAKTLLVRKDVKKTAPAKPLSSPASSETLASSAAIASSGSGRLSQASTLAERASWTPNPLMPFGKTAEGLIIEPAHVEKEPVRDEIQTEDWVILYEDWYESVVASDSAVDVQETAAVDSTHGFQLGCDLIDRAAAARKLGADKIHKPLPRKLAKALAAVQLDERALAKMVLFVDAAYRTRCKSGPRRGEFLLAGGDKVGFLFVNLLEIGALSNELADRLQAFGRGVAHESVAEILADMIPRMRSAYVTYASKRASIDAAYWDTCVTYSCLFRSGDALCRSRFPDWNLSLWLHEPIRRLERLERHLMDLARAARSGADAEDRATLKRVCFKSKALFDEVLFAARAGYREHAAVLAPARMARNRRQARSTI